VNQILGNLLAALLFVYKVPTSIIFGIFSSIAVFACISFFLLKTTDKINPSAGVRKVGITATIALLKEKYTLILIPAMLFSGLTQSFFFGAFPRTVSDTLGIENVGWVMACFGVSNVLGSAIMGKVSDKLGRRPIVVIGSIALFGGTFLTYYATTQNKILALYIVAGILNGISDSGFNTQLYSVLGAIYPDRTEAAFATLKLFQALSTGCAFVYGPYVSLASTLIILISFNIVGVSLFFLCCTV